MKCFGFGLAAIALVVALPALAQVGAPIACPNTFPPEVTFNPSVPQSTDPIAIFVVPQSLVPGDVLTSTINATVSGAIINVTVTGNYNGFALPNVCGKVIIGPLPRGTYTVNYFQGVIPAAPTLQLTTSLLVADPIPTLSIPALLALALLVTAAASAALRRSF